MLNRWFQKVTEPVIEKWLEKLGWSDTVFPSLLKKLPSLSAVSITTGMAGMTASMIYANQREHVVKAKKFENDCNGTVKNSSEFQEIDKPNHGSLTASVIQNVKTGDTYLKKAAHSRNALIHEFMMSNFFHTVSQHQPECLILQTEDKKDAAHFHTLSRKYPNTQDVEDFIRAGKLNELKNKKVNHLEESLAAVHLAGKQVDNTLSNLLIQETKDEFKISSIDHESSFYPGFRSLNSGRMRFPTHPSTLINSIRDLSAPSDDNKSGLAGDARAIEFGNIASKLMSQEKAIDYYERVANVNVKPLIDNCYELANHSTLFKAKDCALYDKHFQNIKEAASKHTAQKK